MRRIEMELRPVRPDEEGRASRVVGAAAQCREDMAPGTGGRRYGDGSAEGAGGIRRSFRDRRAVEKTLTRSFAAHPLPATPI
jgi:hypothetical protein